MVTTAMIACGAPRGASDDSPLARAASPVVGGVADTGHPSVVAIVTGVTSLAPEQCSGVVVAPRVVLTAGHCTIGRAPADLVVDFGAAIKAPAHTVAVAAVHTYARFANTLDDAREGRDLGALVLAEDANVVPATLGAGDLASRGAPLIAVGYGQTSATDRESNGARVSAPVVFDGACDRLLAFGDARATGCHGDSGGALFASSNGGDVLVGVISGRAAADTTCDPPTVAVRVDAYRAWVDALVASAPDDACVSTCPSISVDCPLMADAGANDASREASDAPDATDALAARPTVSGSSCALAPRARTSRTGALLFTAFALVVLARRRRVRDLNRS